MSPQPKYEITSPTFPTQPAAYRWVWHLARTSHRRCQVRKLKGAWRVWRAAA